MQANKQQQRAIAHNTGPALILAGPGSGKTFTTVERVRYLIEVHHADPSHILVITFTKAAARQMRDRFFARMDNQFFPVTFGTFHAVFFHILKTSCHYNGSSILKEKEKREYLRAALLTLPKKFYAKSDGKMDQEWEQGLLSEIGFIKNIGKLPADFTSEYVSRQEFMRIFVSFQKQLAQEKKLDLDDFAAAVHQVQQAGVSVYAAHLRGKNSYACQDYTKGTAFLIGNEGNGLREETAELADCYIRIPMEGKVESLNAAVASSILMYEAHRQRETIEK